MRVLQKTATLGPGGIQSFLINVQANLNKDKIQYDYFLNSLEESFYSVKATNLGSVIYGRTSDKGILFFKLIKRYWLFSKVIRKNKYSCVHISEHLIMAAISTFVARVSGCKVIIVHSHNDHLNEPASVLKRSLFKLARNIIGKLGTHYWACSERAAIWFFPERIIKNKTFTVINNAIEYEKFSYKPNVEKEYRRKFDVENKFVLGHVGRFFYQKNHKKIIDIFLELTKINADAVLVLVGDGELRQSIISYIEQLGLTNKVIFTGVRSDVNNIVQMFDAFVFPSHYEGLGIVAIETQAASIPTFCAYETIPKEVNITSYCHFISLDCSNEEWAKKIIEITSKSEKKSTKKEIIDAGFEITKLSNHVQELYLHSMRVQ